MGPLQVLCITVDERMYDGQYCLAQKSCNIVWQVCLIFLRITSTHVRDIVWQDRRITGMWISILPPFGRSSGYV